MSSSSNQQLRSTTSTAILHELLEVPLLFQTLYFFKSLRCGTGERSVGTRSRRRRSAATPIITNYDHNTCDTHDEDPRPAKRRKPCSMPTATPILCTERAPKLRPSRLSSPSFMQVETDDAQSQTPWSTFIDSKQRDNLRLPRIPPATAESVPAAQEWPLHGSLKLTRIGKETTFNLEFHLTHLPEDLEPSALFAALSSSSIVETSAQPRISHGAPSRIPRRIM
jgi:hypothetical protein